MPGVALEFFWRLCTCAYASIATLVLFEALFFSLSFSGVVMRVVAIGLQKLLVKATELPTMMPGIPFGLFWLVCTCRAVLSCLVLSKSNY